MRDSVFSPGIVVGYHGCTRSAARSILAEVQFQSSNCDYEWLGEGIYFWEYAPRRALEWATRKAMRARDKPAVLEAEISLGTCMNLLDIEDSASGLSDAFQILKRRFLADGGQKLPLNTSSGAHRLDCAVINLYASLTAGAGGRKYQTVRGCYPEGFPIYDGSRILSKSHVQIAVREPLCITRVRQLDLD